MSSVEVYIYDLSQGLAKAMSLQLIGQYLEGIWHTGIVVYGKEYFFGSGGIDMCPPGGTILGQPLKKENLGRTEIPEDVFNAYLAELSESRFRYDSYHLFDHNCNTFSDEAAYFLTNKHIPAYITNLPATIMNTPIGMMLRVTMDSIAGSVSGNSPFGVHPSAATSRQQEATKADSAKQDDGKQGAAKKPASPRKGGSSSSSGNNSSNKSDFYGMADVVMCEEEISRESFSHWRSIASEAKSSLCDLYEFATASVELNWGLGPKHFALIGPQLKKETLADQKLILTLYMIALRRSQDVAMGLIHDRSRSWVQLLSEDHSDATPEFKVALAQVACNLVAQLALANRPLPDASRTPLVDLAVSLLDSPAPVLASASQLAYNLTCVEAVRDDAVLSLGSILIHVLSGNGEEAPDTVHRFASKALLQLCRISDDIRQLAIVQGLDANIIPGADGERLHDALHSDS